MAAWYHAAVRRARRRLLLGFGSALAIAVGCRSASESEFPGTSTASRGAAPPPKGEPGTLGPWAELETVRSWPPMTETPIRSEGHLAGRYDVQVRITPASRRLYAELVRGAEMPDETLVAKFHFERASKAAGPIYAMHKQEGRWEYLVAGPDGQLSERGDLELCRRCHAEAVADSLFGPPGRFEKPGGDPDGGE